MEEPKYKTESWDIPIEEFKFRIMRTVTTDSGVKAVYAAYPDARTVSHHLDRLFGPAGWTDSYEILASDQKSVVCVLKVKMNDEWISKSDVGNVSDIEPMKGGFSDAFKRAAAKLGVGRNAYDIPELWGPVYTKNERHYKPREAPDGRPMDEWLAERAYQALRGEAPEKPKAQVKPQEPTPQPAQIPNDVWDQFMETMKALNAEHKERVKVWWLENGDGTSKPSPDTDTEALTKIANFATSVFMEAEMGATSVPEGIPDTEPF